MLRKILTKGVGIEEGNGSKLDLSIVTRPAKKTQRGGLEEQWGGKGDARKMY